MPTAFHWILPRKLAGSGMPGLLHPLEDDLAYFRHVGIRVIVTLTEERPPADWASAGFHLVHFPIDDMRAPTPRETHSLCTRIGAIIDAGDAVLFHCKAGLGRTGTLLAAFLVTRGQSAPAAIQQVRSRCLYYIQSEAQERFLRHYEEFVAESDSQQHDA